ncbi:sugar kinase [Lonepinella koalarum]|uniref:Sulfofructose kinase n=1 Tax=Lonepinella koalarum TaxID=53417 RepID=A0A4R1KNC5_9PAST|nr:sugar kinase [Lonepinella koalarum]MDH2925757.1 ribokinase [Lonepinella koalarum]TCK66574.1 sulfofructose kinase [Lonepinella koalarum]TFJ89039.1 sugar kinase [Lonepinella koalarum]TYG34879.1 sugar kinase [Lonepinella koalarum]
MKIACVGIAVQDRIYYIEKMFSQSGKYVSHHYKEVGGGPAATAAVTIAKLGGKVDFIGRVGDDFTGKSLLSELETYGVNTKTTKIYKNAKSSQSAIFVDNMGERLICNYPSPDLLENTKWLNSIDFSQYNIILCDVRWHKGTLYCLKKAQELNITTVLDADITPQSIISLVKLADFAVFSEPGLLKMSKYKNIDTALDYANNICKGNVYVTLGEKGCNWLENNQIKHHNGFKVQVIDTTGAGDVFHGAFAFALANGYSSDKLVEFASAVAALKCEAPGGREGIPNLEQVNIFLESKNNNLLK